MTKQNLTAAGVLALLALSACSNTQNGVRIGVGTGHSEEYAARQQAKQQAKAAAVMPAELARQAAQWAGSAKAGSGVIVVGETGVLSKLSDTERAQFYQAYLKAAQRDGGQGGGAEAAFVAGIGGLSSIETYKVPGLYRQDLPLAVPVAHIGKTVFASTAGSLIAGATGDLVAARNSPDGLLVLEQVLCKEAAADYRSCVANFAKGRFDPRSGAELDTNFKPKAGGARIDTATYRIRPAAL
jgi:hypothetical protein